MASGQSVVLVSDAVSALSVSACVCLPNLRIHVLKLMPP